MKYDYRSRYTIKSVIQKVEDIYVSPFCEWDSLLRRHHLFDSKTEKWKGFPFLPPLCCSSCPDLLNCDQIAGSLLLTAVTRKFLTSTCLGSQSLGILKFWNKGRPRSYISQQRVSIWVCLKWGFLLMFPLTRETCRDDNHQCYIITILIGMTSLENNCQRCSVHPRRSFCN